MINKTVKELRVIAKSYEIAKSYSMNKAQLVEAIELAITNYANKLEDSFLEESTYEPSFEDLAEIEQNPVIYDDNYSDQEIEFEELPVQSNRTVSMFDIERYAKFVAYKTYIASPISPKQLNLVKSLEINFKVSIDIKSCNNFYELSSKLSKVYQAILEGKVEYRSEEDILARLKGYKSTPKPSIKTVQPIVESQPLQEVAVSTTSDVIETKLADTTFRTKFQAMMKRLLG